MAKTPGSSKGRSREQVRPRLGVVVVDPLAVVRAGLGMLIGHLPDMQVLAEAGTADECLAALRRIRRSRLVVLVGLGLPGERDSLWLIGTLRERYPHATILASGAGADATTISRGLLLGADGYLDKDVDPVEFLEAIRQAARGEAVLAGAPVDWMGSLADGFDRTRHIESRLTRREHQVLQVAAEGLTAREIARHLGVRERTVTTHLGRIYGKLGVNSRVGAVIEAARSGLVTVGSGKVSEDPDRP
jgi:DNA-binding NarL/FixJ family response regulator